MISAMNPQTIIVPKSGWRKMSAMGMAASTTASSNLRHDSPRRMCRCEHCGQGEDERHLADLRRLDLDKAQLEPGLGAIDRTGEEDRHQR